MTTLRTALTTVTIAAALTVSALTAAAPASAASGWKPASNGTTAKVAYELVLGLAQDGYGNLDGRCVNVQVLTAKPATVALARINAACAIKAGFTLDEDNAGYLFVNKGAAGKSAWWSVFGRTGAGVPNEDGSPRGCQYTSLSAPAADPSIRAAVEATGVCR